MVVARRGSPLLIGVKTERKLKVDFVDVEFGGGVSGDAHCESNLEGKAFGEIGAEKEERGQAGNQEGMHAKLLKFKCKKAEIWRSEDSLGTEERALGRAAEDMRTISNFLSSSFRFFSNSD